MKILGNRVLISKIEEEKKEGFQTVDIQDSFIYKGKVEQVGDDVDIGFTKLIGKNIIFAKYSPNTQEVDEFKIISVDDILAVYE